MCGLKLSERHFFRGEMKLRCLWRGLNRLVWSLFTVQEIDCRFRVLLLSILHCDSGDRLTVAQSNPNDLMQHRAPPRVPVQVDHVPGHVMFPKNMWCFKKTCDVSKFQSSSRYRWFRFTSAHSPSALSYPLLELLFMRISERSTRSLALLFIDGHTPRTLRFLPARPDAAHPTPCSSDFLKPVTP